MVAVLLSPIYIVINFYVANWMLRWMGTINSIFQTPLFCGLYWLCFFLLSTSLLTGFLIRKPKDLHRVLKHTSNYFLGTFLYLLIFISAGDAIRLALKYFFHPSWMGAKGVFLLAGGLCALIIGAFSLYGFLNARSLVTTPYEITIQKTVTDMESLKIVLLADTHFGYNMGEKQARKLVRAINREDPDLVCIAGDFFDNEFDAIASPQALKNVLRSIHSRYGVYACWGNHDLEEPILAGFTFSSPKERSDWQMEAFLKDAGITMLKDAHTLIDGKFYLVGREDPSRAKKLGSQRLSPQALVQNLDPTKPIIFLDHQPKELQEIADCGGDLDLCGHTHAGQILPGNFTTQIMWENSCGYLKKGNLHNIVTSGAGTWGPNMRVGTKNEICSICVHFQ